MSDSVIILAAGDGSRLKSSTPKIFHKIGGLSIIGHVLQTVQAISDDVVLVLKPSYKDYEIEFSSGVTRAFQDKQLGTADATNCGFDKLKDKDNGWVFVLYSDIPLISVDTLKAMISMQNTDASIIVLAMDSENSVGLGKLEPAEEPGTIKGIIEAKESSKYDKVIPLCNTGFMIKKSVLREFLPKIEPSAVTGEYYLTDIVKLAYNAGIKCRYYQGAIEELSGVNTRAELAVLERYFQEKKRSEIMNNGVTLTAPETVFFSYDTKIEKDVTIYPYVYFSTGVHIHSGAKVGPFCVVEGSEIMTAQVGPFSRIRPDTTIYSGAKIGNFVEVKNSKIGEKSKVSHLSYIGDCTIGENTNIGAGTITCNYDGFNKHKTTIGDNVFIGSNTAIVAPVEVEDSAMIAAGSVITKDVSENELGIARGRQNNIPGYANKFRELRRK